MTKPCLSFKFVFSGIAAVTLSLLLSNCNFENGDHHIDTGSELFLQGDFEGAEEELRKALDKNLISYSRKELFTILGNTYNELYLFDSSIVYHKKALALDPD